MSITNIVKQIVEIASPDIARKNKSDIDKFTEA